MAKQAKLGATLSLDGEKEYKKAIDDITAGLKVNYTQMGLVAAQYATAGSSQDALRAKSDALKNAISSQTEKVDLMRKHLDESIKKNGEGEKSTMQLQAAYNKAQTELVKMENQLGQYDDALDQSKDHTTSLSDVVYDISDTFGISLSPALQTSIDKLSTFSASGAAAVGLIGSILTGLGKATLSTSKNADELLTLSSTTGMTTDQLQEFEYASELVDVSSDTMQSSLTKLIKNMSTAKDGTGDAAEAFKKLHIKVSNSNGTLKDANDIFYKVIDKLGTMKNETDRDALSMAIFGKSARELNPLIEAGSDKLKALGVEAHNVGYVMDNETLQQFGQLDDAMQRMSKQGDALKNSFALALLPIMTEFAEVVSKIPTPLLQTVMAIGGLVTVGVLLAKGIRDVAIANAVLSASNAALGVSGTVAGAGLSSMIPALLLIAAIVVVIYGGYKAVSGLLDELSSKSNSLSKISSPTIVPQISAPHYATGTNFHPGGLALVGDGGPELVDLPRGSKVYKNGTAPSGGAYYDQRQYIFKVDDIETYVAIEHRLKNEQTSIRQGVVKA